MEFVPFQVQNWEALTPDLLSSVHSSGLAPDDAVVEWRENPHDFEIEQNQDSFPSQSGA